MVMQTKCWFNDKQPWPQLLTINRKKIYFTDSISLTQQMKDHVPDYVTCVCHMATYKTCSQNMFYFGNFATEFHMRTLLFLVLQGDIHMPFESNVSQIPYLFEATVLFNLNKSQTENSS